MGVYIQMLKLIKLYNLSTGTLLYVLFTSIKKQANKR